jgi:lipid-binding SYLF domain-containing protein
METFKNQETCKPYFENAYGYAVFESITKVGIAFIGGAHGDGNVYILNQNQNQNQSGVDNDNDDGDSSSKYKKVGTSSMFQASIGPQLGGQVYIMIIFFETKREYQQFITTTNFEFGIDANVVALTASAGAAISTIDNNIGVSAGITGMKEYSFEQQSISNTLQYMKGMAIFTSTIGGLMYEATLCGQKYNFTPINDEDKDKDDDEDSS